MAGCGGVYRVVGYVRRRSCWISTEHRTASEAARYVSLIAHLRSESGTSDALRYDDCIAE